MKKGFVMFTMLLVQFTDFVVNAKGSIAGTTYQKGRYGYIRRAKPIPSNPQTIRQMERRSIFAALSSAWKGLTDSQRDGWRNLAEIINFIPIFGVPKPQTGNTLYIALNSNLATVGEDPNDDAPAQAVIPGISAVEFMTLDSTNFKLNVTINATPDNEVPSGTKLVIYATPSLSPGINSPSDSAFRVVSVQDAGVTTEPIDASGDYLSVFSAPIAGSRIFVRVAMISTSSGQSGVPWGFDDIVA